MYVSRKPEEKGKSPISQTYNSEKDQSAKTAGTKVVLHVEMSSLLLLVYCSTDVIDQMSLCELLRSGAAWRTAALRRPRRHRKTPSGRVQPKLRSLRTNRGGSRSNTLFPKRLTKGLHGNIRVLISIPQKHLGLIFVNRSNRK